MSEPITNVEDAVRELGALPVPVGAKRKTTAVAEDVIARAMRQGHTVPALLAEALDSAQLLQSPETAAELEKLRREFAEAAASVAELVVKRGERAKVENALRDEVEQLRARVAALEAAPVTVYRAEHPDSGITLGHYGTEAAARAHCETSAGRDPMLAAATFSWIEDDEDRVAELVAELIRDAEVTTGYIVTALEAPSEYDEEADE